MIAVRALPDLSTPDAFVAWIDQEPYKFEMIGGRLVLMAGGTNPHATISVNTIAALHARLRGGRCRVYNSDFMVQIGATNRYYPDATVACDERRNYTDRPILVVEVMSDGTRFQDLGQMLDAYRQKAGLACILYLHQDRPLAWLWRPGEAERLEYEGLDAVIPLPAIGVTLPMAELYDGIEPAQS